MVQMERLIDRFCLYAGIESETGNEREMGLCLVRDLHELGMEVFTDCAGDSCGSNGFNVFARFPETRKSESILLAAHMDTVKPGRGIRPILSRGQLHTDGSTILSSDDKSGICAIIEALHIIREKQIPHRDAEILFTIGEEGGMRGAKFFDFSRVRSRRAFVLDSDGTVGGIVIEAPGQIKIKAEIVGRSAHAGLEPERGISAIQVAAHAISKMQLLRIDEETTCNIGTFRSEYPTNVVPERALVMAEVRSRNGGKLKECEQQIRQCMCDACEHFGAKMEYESYLNYASFSVPQGCETAAMASRALREIGREPKLQKGNGGSDANIFNSKGIEAVALATGMENVHTVRETLPLEELKKTTEFVLALLTGEEK